MALFIDKSIYSRVLFAISAMGSAFGPLLIGRLNGNIQSKYAISAMLIGFIGTLIFYYTDVKPEGNPFERILPFVISSSIVYYGMKKG